MRTKLFTIFMAVTSLCLAQEIKVKESTEKFSSGNNNAFVTTIYENTLDNVISEWKSKLKDFKHEKVKASGDEIFADNILIKEWGNNPVDIYTRFEENKSDKSIKMMVAVDLGGAYLKSNEKDKSKLIENLMREFALKMTKEPIEKNMKAATVLLAKLEDNQKDLEKENKNLKEDIENYKAKIKKAEDDVKKNDENQAKKKAEIDAQKKIVEGVKKSLDGVK